jgi:hypothetical protein
MTPDELRSRFRQEIDSRGVDDRYIDGVEERELMQIALAHGFDTQAARNFLVETCQERGYVIEAAVVARIRQDLVNAAGIDGRLDRRGYERVVNDARTAVRGTTRNDRDIRRLVLETLADAGRPAVKTGWLFDWHTQARRRAGI